jgi:uncharacterized protein
MSSQEASPAKTVVEYRVRPGSEPEFEAWLQEVIDTASRSFGLEGSTVLTSSAPGGYYLLLRFASAGELERWTASAECARLHREAEHLTAPGAQQVREGLATWFTLPEHRTAADPPRWKMAFVTWCALYPQIVLLAYLMGPLSLSPLVGQAVSSMLCVASLAWAVMPFLTRRLHGWLTRSPK